MRIHLRLTKGLSFDGVVKATKKNPDVYTEDEAVAKAAVATGYFKVVADEDLSVSDDDNGGHLDAEQLKTMKLEELKKLASDMGVNTEGLRSKADYVEAIAAISVELEDEIESEGELDFSEE